jgi:hypothetical protein
MQVISVNSSGSLVERIAVARSVLIAVLLLAAGLALAWLCLGTPLVSGFIPYGRPSPAQVAVGVLAWGFALLLPGAFLLMGIARMASALETLAATRPRRVTPHLAQALGADHLAATDVLLPGGRHVHEMVLGPFGIAVLGDVPPRSATRHVGARWEIRDDRGRWIPIEDPVQRTSRDAERVRSWLGADDRDFLVRVYAAIVTDDAGIERLPGCAVVAPRELEAWLEALPMQRGLTTQRREHLAALVRGLAEASSR